MDRLGMVGYKIWKRGGSFFIDCEISVLYLAINVQIFSGFMSFIQRSLLMRGFIE